MILSQQQSRTIKDGRARTIGFRVAGDAGSNSVMFLHGIGTSATAWDHQLAWLGQRYYCIAWNAPGYGDSPAFTHPKPTMADYASRLADLLDELEIQTCILVANSWGCLVAAEFARLFPLRLRGLVLVSPTAGYNSLPAIDRARIVSRRLADIRDLGPAALVKQAAPRLAAPGTSEAVLKKIEAYGEHITSRGMIHAVEAMGQADIFGLKLAPAVPVQIVCGDSDQITPINVCAAPLSAMLPGSSLIIAASCGHIIPTEAPGWFTETLENFVGPRLPS